MTERVNRLCVCSGDCEGGPECFGDEGSPDLVAPESGPPPEQPYSLPGTQPAFEPETEPGRPLTVDRLGALLAKDIG
jgi:hypothetical protein